MDRSAIGYGLATIAQAGAGLGMSLSDVEAIVRIVTGILLAAGAGVTLYKSIKGSKPRRER